MMYNLMLDVKDHNKIIASSNNYNLLYNYYEFLNLSCYVIVEDKDITSIYSSIIAYSNENYFLETIDSDDSIVSFMLHDRFKDFMLKFKLERFI